MTNKRLIKESIEALKKNRTISDLRIIDETIKNKLKKSKRPESTRKYSVKGCAGDVSPS